MRHFPDTSFFCALYRSQTNSGDADRYMAQVSGPIQTSSLVLLEFRQSIRLQIRLHALDKTKGFSQREGEKMLQDIQADWASGLIETVRVDGTSGELRSRGLNLSKQSKSPLLLLCGPRNPLREQLAASVGPARQMHGRSIDRRGDSLGGQLTTLATSECRIGLSPRSQRRSVGRR